MKISESEMEIMNIIWNKDEPVTSGGLMKELNKEWQSPTVRTFLIRLTAKGILKVSRSGGKNYYTPLISREEYKRACTEEFINDFHSGSLKNMLATLYGDQKPSKEDMSELKQWFEEL